MKYKGSFDRILHSRILWIFVLNAILIVIPVTGYYFIQSKNYQAAQVRGTDMADIKDSIISLLQQGYSFDVIHSLPMPAPYQRFILIDSTNNRMEDSTWLCNENFVAPRYEFFLLTLTNSFVDRIHEPVLGQEEILERLSAYIKFRETRYSVMDYRFNYSINHFDLDDGTELSLITLIDKLDIQYTAKRWKIVLLIVSLVSMMAALIISIIYYRGIIKPLLILTREANLIVDLEKIPEKMFSMKERKDEIGILSRAFYKSSLELIQKKESIETFSSDVLHELKNPLTAMRNGIELLEKREDLRNDNEILSIISRESGRIEKLLFDIRQYSLFDTHPDKRESCRLETIIEEVLSLYGSAGIQLEMGEKPYPKIPLSSEKLVCILTNLIDNALDFSPDQGSITVKYFKKSNSNVLAVIDEGPGIPNGEKEKIFSRFYSNRSDLAEGKSLHSGLGLSIVRRILQSGNHSIRCEDNTPQGACFFVQFNGCG